MRVLQVEDDPATAKAIETMLASKGYDCQTTAFGEEAVDLATRNAYDVILLDVMLPDIDGYEVLRRLHEAHLSTPVLIQSGLIGRDEIEKGAGFGVEHFLIKPFGKSELIEHIQAALAGDPGLASQDRPPGPDGNGHDAAAQADELERQIRRRHPRVRTLKSADIVYNNSSCLVDCLVLNVSDGGAALQVAANHNLPRTFLLRMQHGPTYFCESCWRHGDKMGVRFLYSGPSQAV